MNIARALRGAAAGLLAGLSALALPVRAEYPDKPIRMVIPFAAGGATDQMARIIGKHLTEAWGQPVVSDNRAGANGVIGTDIVAKSPGDGYTLELVAMGHAVNPLLYRKLPYDTDHDFTPISLIATYPQAVLVPPNSPSKDLQALLERARANPDKPLNFASGGAGSSQHLAAALFASMAGIQLTHIPYKGGAPALMDVAAGTVDLMISSPPLPYLQSGRMRALAITSHQRVAWLPDLPTVEEVGVPGYQSLAWYGLIAPKGLPPAVMKKLATEVAKALKSKELRDAAAVQGGEPAVSSPESFAAFIQAERKRYAPIVREAHISLD
ncbi:MAG: tripartite tricarboxylate transporter substrate binding protein [Pseudomonadota bacterium]